MNEIINLDDFRAKQEAKEAERIEKEETDRKIMKRLEEREAEIVSASLVVENITADDFLDLIKYLKELREEKGVDFKVENFKTDSENPIIVQPEDSH